MRILKKISVTILSMLLCVIMVFQSATSVLSGSKTLYVKDIKLIYAGMLEGDFDDNLTEVEDMPLGPVLEKLQKLDNSDNSPYLTEKDYKLLQEIKDIRNWLVHKSYIDFIVKHIVTSIF